MNAFGKPTVAQLRANLVSARKEKRALEIEIISKLTTPVRKRQAIRRYSAVVADVRRAADDLQKVLLEYSETSDTKLTQKKDSSRR
jgi:hypothetical protein